MCPQLSVLVGTKALRDSVLRDEGSSGFPLSPHVYKPLACVPIPELPAGSVGRSGDVVNGHHLQAHQQQPQPLGAEPTSNGNETLKTDVVNSKSTTEDEVTTKQPSYVALACCISGYTTLGYDSKQRQGLRSRPVSPIRGVSPIRTEEFEMLLNLKSSLRHGSCPPITFDRIPIPPAGCVRYLGPYVDQRVTRNPHTRLINVSTLIENSDCYGTYWTAHTISH
ncbi:hypothetical protein AAG570_010330 [Ranatra chinensis]|uniref:Uncharacterized protein n=1 Tax=Ranatra chinensis TaxID=642074 RepID=A0ABD0YM99_9HEMI